MRPDVWANCPWKPGDLLRFHDIGDLRKAQAESSFHHRFWYPAYCVVLEINIDTDYDVVVFYDLDHHEVREELYVDCHDVFRLASRPDSDKT